MSKDLGVYLDNLFDNSINILDRKLYLDVEIDDWSVRNLLRGLHYLEAKGTEPITVHINSPGGDVYGGLAIYDNLMTSPCEIRTEGTGLVASMAAIIFLAGSTRLMSANCKYMVHPIHAWTDGSTPDLKVEMKEILDLEKRMLDIMAERTKQPREFWRKYEKAKYFSLDECVKYGIVTKGKS